MKPEVVRDIATRIKDHTLGPSDDAWRDARHIEKLVDDGHVSSGVNVESIVDVFIGIRHAKGFGELDEKDQELLQDYIVTTINLLTGREDQLNIIPHVDTLQTFQDLFKHKKISPSLVWAAELVALRATIRNQQATLSFLYERKHYSEG